MQAGALSALDELRTTYRPGSGAQKRALLQALGRTRLRSAREVLRLHEMLLFLRAHPDDARTLALARRMLRGFSSRRDVREHRDALENTGIAGASIRFPFFWPTARWLARRWPRLLALDPLDRAADRAIGRLFGVRSGFAALARLRPRGTTDAVAFLRLVERMPGDDFAHEAFYDALEPVLELAPGKDTPSRTLEEYPVRRIAWQREPLQREFPDLATELRRPPLRARALSPREGARLVELARTVMATRARDLDAFEYADRHGARLVEDHGGLVFGLIDIVSVRRAPGIAPHGFLALRNGIPIGYGDLAPAGPHVEVSFNVFATYRGTQAALVFARTLATVRRVFRASSFGIAPYQLGHENREAIDSGAWWFYTKLGLRPRASEGLRLARRELARARADRAYRSSAKTLERLARWPLYYRYH
jgi:hypothetical protein